MSDDSAALEQRLRRGPRPPSVPHPDRFEKKKGRGFARPPSAPFPEDVTVVAASTVSKKRGPRPPSAAHPNDAHEDLNSDLAGSLQAPKEKKKGGIKKIPGKIGKQIKKKHACERAFMCALAVSLLWMTSLAVSKEIVKYFILTPSLNKVVESWNFLVKTTVDQRGSYKTAANNQYRTCDRKYNETLEQAEEQLLLAQISVDQYLLEFRTELVQCQDAYYEGITVLDYLSRNLSQDMEKPEFYKCEPGELNTILSSQVVSRNAINDVENYKNASDKSINSLRGQLKKRMEYDVNYLDRKTGGMLGGLRSSINGNLTDPEQFKKEAEKELNKMMACFSESGEYSGTYSTVKEACAAQSVFAKMKYNYDNAMQQYEVLKNDVNAYKEEALAKFRKFEDFYKFLERVYNSLDAAAILQLSGWDLGVIGSLGALDALQDLLNFDIRATFDTPEKIYRRLESDAQAQVDEIAKQAEKIKQANLDVEAQALDLEINAFSDYNPPPVDDDGEYDKESDSIVGKVTSSLGAIQANANDRPDLNEIVDKSQVNISEASSRLLEKSDPRTWSFFEYENSVFSRFELGLQSFSDYALAFDYAYRILSSLMLIRKYWNLGSINTPPADVRTKAGIASGLFSAQKSLPQKIAAILTHPAVNLLMILFFLTMFATSFYLAYEPIYSQYTAGCIDSCWVDISNTVEELGTPLYPGNRSGTMLYRNAYVVAEQYAFTDGDYVTSTKIDSLNVERELTCRDKIVASLDVKLNQDNYFQFYEQRLNNTVTNIDFLRRCVNINAVNQTYKTQINDANAQSNSLDAILQPLLTNVDRCNRLFDPIKEKSRVFECSLIHNCTLDAASGPNEPILRGATHSSMCTAEWYFHASMLGSIMVTVVFCLINLSRFVFLRSITKIWWRHLVANRFSFLASCTESGRVIYPEVVSEKGESFRKVITKQLRIALARFEREGYIELFFAILFNIPWITILAVLSRKLAFDEDKVCN